jgi:hypothetical protein
MNCRNFETNITELARGQMLEARAKNETLAHLEECQRCAARFADEQALTTGLSFVAATAATVETPSHVEEALLLAFRQRRDAASSTVVPFTPTKVMPRWMPLSIAAAAALLVVTTLGLLRLLPTGAHDPVQQEASTGSPSQSASSAPTQAEAVPDSPIIDVPDNPEPKRSNGMTPPYAVNRPRSPFRPAELSGRANRRDARYNSAMNASEEIATDFLPLSYGSDLTQLEGGQVVRVELPRAALQSLGLPMNVERASERVKADVLIGSDGVARAIRFVR